MLATQNRISIFKPRKDKKGYTRTLLTIPQLKSRLTRHGISYKIKMSKFGMLAPGSEILRSVTDILEEMDSTRPFSENESPPVATDQEMTTGRESGLAYKRQLIQLERQYDEAVRSGRGTAFYRGMLGTRLGRVLLYKMMLVHLEPDMLRQSADSRERAYNTAYTFFRERPEEERIRFATIYANRIAATRRRYYFITYINLNRADYNFRETPQEIEKEKMDAYRAYMADKGIIVSPTTRFPEAGWDIIDPKFLLIENITGFGRRMKFGMQSLDATSRAMRRSALRSGNAPYTNVYSEISDLTSRNPGRTSEAARGSAILVSAVRAAQIAEMRAAAARMRERVEAHRAAARARYREQQLTGRGGSGDFEDTTSTGFGRRMKFGMEAPSDVPANAHAGPSTEHQSPPWRDSPDPPFHGMSEEDYNEVQAMIRSRPQRRRQPRQPLTPEQLAARAERWERRAEELESRGESSEGWTEWRDGQRVPLPSWREILEARRIRNQPFQSAVQNAVARYLESNPPGAGAAFGVLQPTRSVSDSRNIRRDSEEALREMWNLRRNRARERMRREIAGDIIFPDRPWHRAAPPYATTIQRYARGMIARNMN